MNVKMMNGKLAVSKITKDSGHKQSLLSMPDSADTVGLITYLPDDYEGSLEVGQKVVFGDSRNRVILSGQELEIMSPDNIFMILEAKLEIKKESSETKK